MQKICNKQPRAEAISSLVLGIISILANASIPVYRLVSESAVLPYNVERVTQYIPVVSVFWGWLIPILGFALGIMGLRSRKKNLAITGLIGTILSFTGLVIYICLGYIFDFSWGWDWDIIPFASP